MWVARSVLKEKWWEKIEAGKKKTLQLEMKKNEKTMDIGIEVKDFLNNSEKKEKVAADNQDYENENENENENEDEDENENGHEKNNRNYLDNESSLVNQFIYTMYVLLESGVRASEEKISSIPIEKEISRKSFQNDEIQKRKNKSEKKLEFFRYEKKSREKEVLEKIKDMNVHLVRARYVREKLKILKLLNYVSEDGHTLISWSASVGK